MHERSTVANAGLASRLGKMVYYSLHFIVDGNGVLVALELGVSAAFRT
jgi:hypothetical protein